MISFLNKFRPWESMDLLPLHLCNNRWSQTNLKSLTYRKSIDIKFSHKIEHFVFLNIFSVEACMFIMKFLIKDLNTTVIILIFFSTIKSEISSWLCKFGFKKKIVYLNLSEVFFVLLKESKKKIFMIAHLTKIKKLLKSMGSFMSFIWKL